MNKKDWYIDIARSWDRRAEKTSDSDHPAIIRGNSDPKYLEQLYKDAALYKELMCIQTTEVFLDLACGNGIFLTYLSEDASISIGLDISSKMLQQIDKEKGKILNLNLLQGNLLSPPFKSNSVDKILLNSALQYLRREDVIVVLQEIFRILKRGGGVVCLTEIPTKYCTYAIKKGIKQRISIIARLILKGELSTTFTRFTPSKLRKEILEIGFVILSEGTLHYSFPEFLKKYLSKKYMTRQKYSSLFSFTYYFLLKKQ